MRAGRVGRQLHTNTGCCNFLPSLVYAAVRFGWGNPGNDLLLDGGSALLRPIRLRVGNPKSVRVRGGQKKARFLAGFFGGGRGIGQSSTQWLRLRVKLRFDNAAARSIVSILSAGPASLAEIIAKSTLPSQNLLANLLVLCTADAVWPVEPHHVSVVSVNEAIRRRLSGPQEIQSAHSPAALLRRSMMFCFLFSGMVVGPTLASTAIGRHFFTSHGLSSFGARTQCSNRRPQPSLSSRSIIPFNRRSRQFSE